MAFVLAETAAGYALLKAADKKIHKSTSLVSDLATPEQVIQAFKVHRFQKFESAADALAQANAVIEGQCSSELQKFLEEAKPDKKATLIVSEAKLGNAINKLGLNFSVVADAACQDVHRAIKEFLPELLPGLDGSTLNQMSLGLAHSMGRHKLKFSADKVDVMIVQAIALLDDLDKELNTYAMRMKEWYGWHFPELAKLIVDSSAYAKIILTMGYRSNAADTDLSEILPEEQEEQVKTAAEVSMGTEITPEDLASIQELATQVVDFAAYREQLSNYLSSRMKAIAPNLTMLVGELVGARLIAHAGSLTSLAKAPASTIQILGAEKALFRALKTKHDTPKYGILYHASLVGQASGKNKGRIARVLAAKAACGVRYDSFAEERDDSGDFGVDLRGKVESRLSALEGKDLRTVKTSRQQQKIEISEARAYNADADAAMDSDDEEEPKKEVSKKRARDDSEDDEEEEKTVKKEKKEKKEKKDKKEKKEKKDKKEKKEKKDKKEKKEKKEKKDKKNKD